MMEWTDRHCRFFHRLLTRRALIYTEMVTTGAVIHGDRQRLLGFDPFEHPIALQLGGSDPRALAECAKIAEDFGYDEINLNVGCPSDRVQEGRFGACLMAEPGLVGDCVAAMKRSVAAPVTVKCRIGIDEQDPEHALEALTGAAEQAGGGPLRCRWVNSVSYVTFLPARVCCAARRSSLIANCAAGESGLRVRLITPVGCEGNLNPTSSDTNSCCNHAT
jgi:tRNA-dihydrouridine synthase A